MARLPALPALLALLALLAGCGGDEGEAATAAAGPGSTLEATLADPDGNGFLAPGPPEPLLARGEPGPPGRTLATFAQLTDTHVRDEESPARVPFLDRLGTPFNSTFRPHEALSPQVLDAAVRALARQEPQAVAVTGDVTDSAQANELDQALALLQGGRVEPDTGGPGYRGVQEASNPDPFYFRPDNDAPRRPGILDAAQAPFDAPGLGVPVLPAVGNHDVLVQGEVPPTPAIAAVAAGSRMVTGLDPDAEPPSADVDAAAAVEQLLTSGEAFGRSEPVPADPERRHLGSPELVARLAEAAGVAPRTPERLDYVVDVGPAVRAVVLDTVNRTGGSEGVLAPEQVAWLREQLAAAGPRWVVVFSHNPLDATAGGEAALAALDAAPRVAAAVAGNRHRNTIEPRDGYWLIGTSSLADFPQQSRMFRLREAPGGAVLETWMVDHDGRGLAGTSRELAYLDAQGGRPLGFRGERGDRNAALAVRP